MIHVVEIPERDGKPVLSWAAKVVAEDGSMFTAYVHPLGSGHATLFRLAPGLYVMASEGAAPEPRGTPFAQWARSPQGRRLGYMRVTGTRDTTDERGDPITVPYEGVVRANADNDQDLERATDASPVVIGNIAIKRARPGLPVACGVLSDARVERDGRKPVAREGVRGVRGVR